MEDELDSTWKQTERNVQKDAFREGVSEGRDSTFQEGFDEGYEEGYRIGRLLGQAHGKQRILEAMGKVSPSVPVKEENRHGSCIICKENPDKTAKAALPDKIYNTPYEDIKLAQKTHNNELEKKLQDD